MIERCIDHINAVDKDKADRYKLVEKDDFADVAGRANSIGNHAAENCWQQLNRSPEPLTRGYFCFNPDVDTSGATNEHPVSQQKCMFGSLPGDEVNAHANSGWVVRFED